MNKLLGSKQVYPDSAEGMKRSSYNLKDTKWVAFQNHAADSRTLGHTVFLAIGPENTIKEVPEHLPDSKQGAGWKYLPVGYVNLETGLIEEESDEQA